MGKLREVVSGGWRPLPRDHGRLSAMDASYSYLRQFTPDVLAAIDFQGGPGTAGLMEAVAILKELNRPGGRKVPADAPASFVPGPVRASIWRRREGRGRHRLPALLGAVRDPGPAGRAAQRGHLRAGVTPLRRPVDVPVHPAAVGAQAARVLPAGRQAGQGRRRARPGQGGAARRAGGAGEDPGGRAAGRHRRRPPGRRRQAGDPEADGRGRSRGGQGAARTSWRGCCRSRRSPRC